MEILKLLSKSQNEFRIHRMGHVQDNAKSMPIIASFTSHKYRWLLFSNKMLKNRKSQLKKSFYLRNNTVVYRGSTENNWEENGSDI